MGKKRAQHKKARNPVPKAGPVPKADPVPKTSPAPKTRPAVALGLFAWGLVAHLVYLQDSSVTAFFFGDGHYYLQKALHLAQGTGLDAGLPFHPPLVSWLLVPLYKMIPQASVYVAAKVLMAVANATTYAVLYLLLRPRLPYVTLFCAFLPLSFGELQLSATPNSEAIYRLLLALLLLLGFRWPALGGLLHALAALTRAEHVVLGLLLAALGLIKPERRRFVAVTAGVALAVMLPYTLAVSADLAAYNEQHAGTLPEPLPTLVPVSFYGPLNFALAQTEDGIHFSRRNLPASQSDDTLDPNHPVHNRYIVSGYRVGFEAIFSQPARFVNRSLSKVGHSLRAFAQGWTWRDLPKGSLWTRQPVDMSLASSSGAWFYEGIVLLLILLGAWQLRNDRQLLMLGFALVVFRLAINVAFFPYLRGMAIVAPFVLLLVFHGLVRFFKHLTPQVLGVVWLGLVLFHLVTGLGERKYGQSGERDVHGQILDDRPMVLKYSGS